jgi:bacterioferritin
LLPTAQAKRQVITAMNQLSKEKFVAALNEDLSSEFRSILQYVQHIASIKGARYQQVVDELRRHLSQELDHALILAGQIDFLGGTPTCDVGKVSTKENAEAALKQDLDLEERQLKRYRRRFDEANSLGFPDVAEALAPLLAQTQDHVQDLRGVLDSTDN